MLFRAEVTSNSYANQVAIKIEFPYFVINLQNKNGTEKFALFL